MFARVSCFFGLHQWHPIMWHLEMRTKTLCCQRCGLYRTAVPMTDQEIAKRMS